MLGQDYTRRRGWGAVVSGRHRPLLWRGVASKVDFECGNSDKTDKVIYIFCNSNARSPFWVSGPRWSLKMVHYSLDPENPTESCKSRGSDLRVHFKNTRETAQAIQGMHIWKTITYLKDVTLQKQCVPVCRYSGGVGRCAQAKEQGWTQGR